MVLTKNKAKYEFGLNLIEQKHMKPEEFIEVIENFNWRFWNFELAYWVQELNCGKIQPTRVQER